ncbi:MAG TPA: hypothetical protein VNJ54_01260 [Plantibacter sp.]|uniref:hypothetical protein n=1 Tax=Plantibacter sp. TaxID=1871045 RepID=UPI002BFB46EE|nr:hypothetical protein [Plantibacter sp.]
MNELLKKHGYLYGIPGAYGLTEKGQQFAEEQYHSRGTGGYAQYNPHWETRTWNDETAAALKADLEADPREVRADVDDVPADEADDFEYETYEDDDDSPPSWVEVAIGGALVAAAFAPHVKPFWKTKVKPAAKKWREKLTTQGRTT